MIFAITEEQTLLGESVQRLLAEANEFEVRRRRLRAQPPDRLALWPQLTELGIIGAAFDEAHGGFAGDPRTVAVIMAQLGASLAVEPYLATAVIAGRILQRATDSAMTELAESVLAGSELCVLAHDAGSNPFAAPSVSAIVTGDQTTLSGSLRCVRHADVATSFLISARTSKGIALYHVPRECKGLTIDPFRLLDGAGGGALTLSELGLPATSQLTFEGDAHAVLDEALEWGLLGLAAETAGIVDALNKATFAYLGTRKQFGVTLSTFQALQHRAADMYIAAEEIFAIVDAAIEAFDASTQARSAAVSAAKVVADTAGRRVGHESVQMHGGMGVSDELNVSHYARRLATIRAELGSADQHRFRFGSLR